MRGARPLRRHWQQRLGGGAPLRMAAARAVCRLDLVPFAWLSFVHVVMLSAV